VIALTDAGPIVVTCGMPWVIAYEPEFGGELWRCEGLAGDVAVSPVYANGMVFVTNDGAQAMAIRIGGKGDVTKTHVKWTATQGLPDAASPVCDGKFFLQGSAGGEVTCFDAATGKLLWSHDCPTGFWSSPMLAGDVVYATDMDGKTTLFKLADKFEALGENKLGETVHATPAFCDGEIFFRGTKHLFAVGGKK
jgi:outer membrane protein assembly factor BamB